MADEVWWIRNIPLLRFFIALWVEKILFLYFFISYCACQRATSTEDTKVHYGNILKLTLNVYLVIICTFVFIIVLSKRKYEKLLREDGIYFIVYNNRLKLF